MWSIITVLLCALVSLSSSSISTNACINGLPVFQSTAPSPSYSNIEQLIITDYVFNREGSITQWQTMLTRKPARNEQLTVTFSVWRQSYIANTVCYRSYCRVRFNTINISSSMTSQQEGTLVTLLVPPENRISVRPDDVIGLSLRNNINANDLSVQFNTSLPVEAILKNRRGLQDLRRAPVITAELENEMCIVPSKPEVTTTSAEALTTTPEPTSTTLAESISDLGNTPMTDLSIADHTSTIGNSSTTTDLTISLSSDRDSTPTSNTTTTQKAMVTESINNLLDVPLIIIASSVLGAFLIFLALIIAAVVIVKAHKSIRKDTNTTSGANILDIATPVVFSEEGNENHYYSSLEESVQYAVCGEGESSSYTSQTHSGEGESSGYTMKKNIAYGQTDSSEGENSGYTMKKNTAYGQGTRMQRFYAEPQRSNYYDMTRNISYM